jgi:hypothetical protein
MRRVFLSASLPLLLVTACQSGSETDADASDRSSVIEAGQDLDVSTVGATTELVWSAITLAGMAAVVQDVAVYYELDENSEPLPSRFTIDR